MPGSVFYLFILAAILGPFMSSARSIRNLFLGWRIPITWISALPTHGWVQVVGKIRGEPVSSWLNNTECLFWQVEVQEYHGGRGGGWRAVNKQSSGPFELDDMTGRVKIQPGNSDLVLKNETILEILDDSLKVRLEALGVKTKGLLGTNKKVRICERTLSPHDDVLVLGTIQKSENQVSISAGSLQPFLISNLDKAVLLKTYFMRTFKPLIVPMLFSFALAVYYIYLMLTSPAR